MLILLIIAGSLLVFYQQNKIIKLKKSLLDTCCIGDNLKKSVFYDKDLLDIKIIEIDELFNTNKELSSEQLMSLREKIASLRHYSNPIVIWHIK